MSLTERLAELDDQYDILKCGDRTAHQVDAEVTAEARRHAAIPWFSPNPRIRPADANGPTRKFPLNRLRFP
ncbi:hypothetical protein [Streptomyces sp. NPDC003393]